MQPVMLRQVPLVLLPLLAAACASTPPPPPPVYLNKEIRRLVVLPPFNETIDAEAWRTVWPPLIQGVAGRGYTVVPQSEVEAFYLKNRFFNTPEEIQIYTPAEVAKEFNAEGVLYTNIHRWGYKYVGVYSEYGVDLEFRLTDAKGGEPAWKDRIDLVRSEAIRGGNLFELAFSLFGVAGNAFMRSSESWARECVGKAMLKMPLAGFGPAGPALPPPPGDLENPETNPVPPRSENK